MVSPAILSTPPAKVISLSGDLLAPVPVQADTQNFMAPTRVINMTNRLGLSTTIEDHVARLSPVGGYHVMADTQGLWGIKKTDQAVDQLAFWKFLFSSTLTPPNYEEVERTFRLPHELYSYQVEGVNFLINTHAALLADDMGTGKEQPLDARLLTPVGWVTMGDVQVGQKVFNRFGQPVDVSAIYPQGTKPVYQITFNDGATVECGLEHLWVVKTRQDAPEKVRPFHEILAAFEQGQRWFIPLCDPVSFDSQPQAIDPYLMGVLLAAGRFSQANVSFRCERWTVLNALKDHLPTDTQQVSFGYRMTLKSATIRQGLRTLGLTRRNVFETFIPPSYLFANMATRKALLAGMVDAAGKLTRHQVVLLVSSQQMAQDVQFLVESLGGSAAIKSRPGKVIRPYEVVFSLPPTISPYQHFQEPVYQSRKSTGRQITQIRYLGEKECQCIAVNSPDHCYLTDHCTVTHNTVQATVSLKVLAYLGLVKRILIICPPSIIPVWQKHIAEWSPELRCLTVRDDQQGRREMWRNLDEADVFITSYPTLRIDVGERIMPKETMKNGFDVCVLDEAHHIRNDSKQSGAVKELQAKRRWALTGTPIQNREDDILNLFDFIYPKYLTKADVQNHTKLRDKLRPHMLRRRKDVELKGRLPPRNPEQEMWLELDLDQQAEYAEVLGEAQEELGGMGDNVTYTAIFAKLTALKQVCNIATGKTTSPKIDLLLEQVDQIRENGDKVIIFSQYLQRGLMKIAPCLERFGYAMIVGGQSDKERAKQLEKFRTTNAPALLVSLQAGGEGLTLTEANYVIHHDHGWNPAQKNQATDRVYRIGQIKTVSVYSYWMKNTIEESIYMKLEEKGLLFRDVVDALAKPNATQLISKREWLRMFGVAR